MEEDEDQLIDQARTGEGSDEPTKDQGYEEQAQSLKPQRAAAPEAQPYDEPEWKQKLKAGIGMSQYGPEHSDATLPEGNDTGQNAGVIPTRSAQHPEMPDPYLDPQAEAMKNQKAKVGPLEFLAGATNAHDLEDPEVARRLAGINGIGGAIGDFAQNGVNNFKKGMAALDVSKPFKEFVLSVPQFIEGMQKLWHMDAMTDVGAAKKIKEASKTTPISPEWQGVPVQQSPQQAFPEQQAAPQQAQPNPRFPNQSGGLAPTSSLPQGGGSVFSEEDAQRHLRAGPQGPYGAPGGPNKLIGDQPQRPQQRQGAQWDGIGGRTAPRTLPGNAREKEYQKDAGRPTGWGLLNDTNPPGPRDSQGYYPERPYNGVVNNIPGRPPVDPSYRKLSPEELQGPQGGQDAMAQAPGGSVMSNDARVSPGSPSMGHGEQDPTGRFAPAVVGKGNELHQQYPGKPTTMTGPIFRTQDHPEGARMSRPPQWQQDKNGVIPEGMRPVGSTRSIFDGIKNEPQVPWNRPEVSQKEGYNANRAAGRDHGSTDVEQMRRSNEGRPAQEPGAQRMSQGNSQSGQGLSNSLQAQRDYILRHMPLGKARDAALMRVYQDDAKYGNEIAKRAVGPTINGGFSLERERLRGGFQGDRTREQEAGRDRRQIKTESGRDERTGQTNQTRLTAVEEQANAAHRRAMITANPKLLLPQNKKKFEEAYENTKPHPTSQQAPAQAPAQKAPAQSAPPAQQQSAPPPEQRKPGNIYPTPRGHMIWTGTGWIPLNK